MALALTAMLVSPVLMAKRAENRQYHSINDGSSSISLSPPSEAAISF